MALIKCPECEQTISDKASKCPKCGYPIKEYLDGKAEETPPENIGGNSADNGDSAIVQKPPKRKKKKIIAIIAASVVVAAAIVAAVSLGLFESKLVVEDITIGKWRLTDSLTYIDNYEGELTSEQKKPFIAVIGKYEDEESAPRFVYMEDGKGVIETWELSDDDPSIKYRPVGYMSGKPVELSELKVKYTDSDYYDYSSSESSNCDVLIDIDMNKQKNGLLVFDVVNETNNETERNKIAVVINGKAEYDYYAELPYKARGIDVSIVPKLFCESAAVTAENYTIEKAYTAEKSESSNKYSGEETLAFADYADGYVLYTQELKEGGNKEDRNVVKNLKVFLHDGECSLTTYDYGDDDEKLLMPKYEFNIVGYITWTSLEKETV